MVYWGLKLLLTPLLRFLYRVRTEGMEHVPQRGAAILASNHVSFCDSIFLPLVLRRRITFVAKAEYFADPKTAWLFRSAGQIPVERGGGERSHRALADAGDVLDAGQLLGIYPEGTRSPDGRLYRGRTGVARLALQHDVPIIAVAMLGTAEVQKIGQRIWTPFRPVTVRFSEPMRWPGADPRDGEALRRITDEVMRELQRLSGQDYVDEYCPRSATSK